MPMALHHRSPIRFHFHSSRLRVQRLIELAEFMLQSRDRKTERRRRRTLGLSLIQRIMRRCHHPPAQCGGERFEMRSYRRPQFSMIVMFNRCDGAAQHVHIRAKPLQMPHQPLGKRIAAQQQHAALMIHLFQIILDLRETLPNFPLKPLPCRGIAPIQQQHSCRRVLEPDVDCRHRRHEH